MKTFSKVSLSTAAILSLTAIAAQADNSPELIIENFVGTINWSNDAGDIRLTKSENIEDTLIGEGNEFLIDGGIDVLKGAKCKGYYGSYDISLFGRDNRSQGKFGGYEDLEDYPILNLTLPTDTKVVIRNSIVFTDGAPDIGSADLQLNHCGKIYLGDVAGNIVVEGRGSSDLTMGDAQELRSEMTGSGDIEAKNIGLLNAEGRGSGDIEIAKAENVDIQISGSGDFEIDEISGSAIIQSSGSGDVDIGDVDGSFDYQGSGSGDLSVDDLRGTEPNRVSLQSSGSGDVSIGSGRISELYARASGSVSMDIDADVINATLKASGSSDIFVERVSGTLEQSESGSADIRIDERG